MLTTETNEKREKKNNKTVEFKKEREQQETERDQDTVLLGTVVHWPQEKSNVVVRQKSEHFF